MTTRRDFLLGTAGLAVAGCAAREESPQEGSADSGSSQWAEKAGIDWTAYQGEQIDLLLIKHWWTDAITERLKDFEALTGMKVNTNVIGDESAYWQQAVVALSSGASTYDGLMVGSLNSGQYMHAGWLAPLNEFFVDTDFVDKSWYALDDVMRSGRSAGSLDDELFSMPVSAEAGLVIYRKDLVPRPPKTHGDLLDIAAKNDRAGLSGLVGRGARGLDIVWVWANFLLSEGGRFFDNGEPAVDSPAAVRATEIYVERLLRRHGPKGAANMSWLEANNYFNEGKAALYPDASGLISLTIDKKNTHARDVGVVRWPRGSQGSEPRPCYWFWSVGIPKSSVKKSQAATFFAWATSPQVSLAIGRAAGTPAARESVWADRKFRSFYPENIADEITANYAQVVSALVPFDRPTFPKEVDVLSVELVNVLNGKNVEQALGAAAAGMARAGQ